MRASKLCPLLVVSSLLAAQPVWSQVANPLVGGPGGVAEDAAPPFPLHVFASVTNSLGQGTFVLGHADNPYFGTSLSFTPYLSWKGFWVMVNQSLDVEWTQSDSTTLPNQLMLSDTVVSARYWGFGLPELGLRFPLTVRADVPLSLASRYAGKLTGVGGTASMQWSYSPWNLMVMANANASYNVIIPSLARPGLEDEVRSYLDRQGNPISPAGCLRRDPTEAGNFVCGSIPRAGAVGAGVQVNWSTLEGQLMLSGSLGISSSFSYFSSPDDEYRSKYARPGIGHSELTRSSLGVTYSPIDWLWLSLSADTVQPLFQANGYDYRWFPFWDIVSPANNYSSLSFDTTFAF